MQFLSRNRSSFTVTLLAIFTQCLTCSVCFLYDKTLQSVSVHFIPAQGKYTHGLVCISVLQYIELCGTLDVVSNCAHNSRSHRMCLAEVSIRFSTLGENSEAFKLTRCVFFSKAGFEEVQYS